MEVADRYPHYVLSLEASRSRKAFLDVAYPASHLLADLIGRGAVLPQHVEGANPILNCMQFEELGVLFEKVEKVIVFFLKFLESTP